MSLVTIWEGNKMTRRLTTGFYRPTTSFASITEHIAVMDAGDQTLVALVGAGDDVPANLKESQDLAALFAAAPELQAALLEIIDQCDEALGEWAPVAWAHLPIAMEPFYRIRETARAALAGL